MSTELTNALVKALEAGNYNAAPGTLVQGAALQREDLSDVMQLVTFDEQHLKLQKMLKVDTCKSLLAQFNRELSYGILGGSSQYEGAVGQEEDGQSARIVVPMAFYSLLKRFTDAANMVQTFDGVKAEDRVAMQAARKLGGDVEFDSFRGKADFSNAGVFDGNMAAIPALPGMLGVDVQVRMSDSEANAQDQMFSEFGSNQSVVISVGGTLTQDAIEDAHVRSSLGFGDADKLVIDPVSLSAYNKISFAKERIILAGSAQDATGADLKRQWVSGGTVNIESSQFLRGKFAPAKARANGPAAPASVAAAASAGSTTLATGNYWYRVTSVNELGESVQTSLGSAVAVTAGQQVALTITHPGSGTVRYFNVYRSAANGSLASAKFIGRVQISSGATTVFTDLGNKIPGFVTGFMLQKDTMALKELCPFSRKKMAVTDLSSPEAFFRFVTLAVMQPRKNVLLDNISGTLS